jgi:pimeloyl-ACP methyl ester carboxylesterase
MKRQPLFLGVAVLATVVQAVASLAAEKTVTYRVDGQKVVGTLQLPDGVSRPPAVLLLHGFTGSRDELEIPSVKEGIFARAARIWATKGIASLRIDFRGNGDSEGKFEDMTMEGQVKDALAALDFLVSEGEVNKDKIALVGWSMGGAVAAAAAGRNRHRLGSVALWAPGSNMASSFALLFGPQLIRDGLDAVDEPVIARLPWGKEVPIKAGLIRSFFAVDPAAEIGRYRGALLVAVGTEDTVVYPQPESGQILLSYHDGPEELWVQPMDHTFNAFENVETVDALIAKTADFIQAHLND